MFNQMTPEKKGGKQEAEGPVEVVCVSNYKYYEEKVKFYKDIDLASQQPSFGMRLTTEIEKFVGAIDLEMSSSRKLRKMLVDQLKFRFQNAGIISSLQIYGSFQTELDLSWSDIDLVVEPTPGNEQFALTQIHDSLVQMKSEANSWVKEIHFHERASVPIIKIDCNYEGHEIVIDITQFNEQHKGIQCIELVQTYLNYFPYLKPLTLILKNLLKVHHLNDPYMGGLSSYGILLMVVAYFQTSAVSGNYNDENLGVALLNILHSYSRCQAVDIIPNIDPSNATRAAQISTPMFVIDSNQLVTITDPINPQNNVARSTRDFYQIINIFEYGYYAMTSICACASHVRPDSKKDQLPECHQDQSLLTKLFLSTAKKTYG